MVDVLRTEVIHDERVDVSCVRLPIDARGSLNGP
jgi:hypothetical protein